MQIGVGRYGEGGEERRGEVRKGRTERRERREDERRGERRGGKTTRGERREGRGGQVGTAPRGTTGKLQRQTTPLAHTRSWPSSSFRTPRDASHAWGNGAADLTFPGSNLKRRTAAEAEAEWEDQDEDENEDADKDEDQGQHQQEQREQEGEGEHEYSSSGCGELGRSEPSN